MSVWSERLRRALFQVLRTLFRLAPLPVATRDRWRQRFLARHADLVPAGPRGQAPGAERPHRLWRRSDARVIGWRAHQAGELPVPPPATLVAFHLPQFHAIPENDRWWGEGFTEWRNVTRALPQFEGHAQPRLPGALGFYDLGQPEAMQRQMQLARAYGIGAFCSYAYWFAGQTLLERPLRHWLDDPALDLPLCLCWANENWARRWDGRDEDILIAQRHSPEDDLAFIAHFAPWLRDPRYLRVAGRPLLVVYRPGLLPDPAATAARWRGWCADHDIGAIHLAYVQSFDRVDPRDIGFDSAIAFPPNNTTPAPITASQKLINPDYHGDVFDWRALAAAAQAADAPDYPLHPGVNPGWDNEPRRSGAGRVFLHASPRSYRDWLRAAIAQAQQRTPEAPLVFINAWNEWAEGAVLEPDSRHGHAWLAATRAALRPAPRDPRPCALVHAWHVDALAELLAALAASGIAWRIVLTTAPEREQAVRACLAGAGLTAEVRVFENHGRDVLPFLQVADELLDAGVELVLKLHTKRSSHRRDGDTWRRELVAKLLAPERAARIVEAFRADPTLGLVAAEGHLQPLGYYWGANQANVEHLCRRMGIAAPDVASDRFIAGTMFWARLAALRPLLDTPLAVDEFEAEAGQVDGTLAHAVERVITLAARHAGMHTATAAELCGGGDTPDAPYPYAARSG